MAMVPRRPEAVARRVAAWSLVADAVIALFFGEIFSAVIGFILFVLGLIVTGFAYFNFRQVVKVRGRR